MLVVLPAIAFFLGYAVFTVFVDSRREALIRAAAVWSAALVVLTELLSLGANLVIGAVAIGWCVVIGAVGFAAWRLGALDRRLVRVPAGLSKPEWIVLAPTLVIALATLVVALVAPPNTYDSLTYHVGRVAHWVQNQSVAHYPTNITRQLLLGPFAEYGILHLQILSGDDDRFANLVQWGAFMGCLASGSLIAKRLGGGRITQLFAALLVATTPMVILQASSTQNDLVCGFWVSCIALFLLPASRGPRPLVDAVFIGIALGISMLTKPTTYFFAFPFFVWFGIDRLRRAGLGSVVLECVVIAVIALSLNAGLFSRNIAEYGAPLGPRKLPQAIYNELTGPADALSAVTKSVFIHWDSPVSAMDEWSEAVLVGLHDWIGVPLNSRRLKLAVLQYEYPLDKPNHEDVAPNFRSFVLLLFVTPFLFGRAVPNDVKRYALCCALGFLLFSLVIRWQPYASRLHTPFFVLITPFTALILTRLLAREKRIAIVAVILGLLSSDCVFANATRPIIEIPGHTSRSIFSATREEQLFVHEPESYGPYRDAIRRIGQTSCRDVGLLTYENTIEYPIWRLADAEGLEMRFRHIVFKERFDPDAPRPEAPCAILSLVGSADEFLAERYPAFRAVWTQEPAIVYMSARGGTTEVRGRRSSGPGPAAGVRPSH